MAETSPCLFQQPLYWGKAVYNALKFREMADEALSSDEKHRLERMKDWFEGKPVPGQKSLVD
jgi:hypothetical protein